MIEKSLIERTAIGDGPAGVDGDRACARHIRVCRKFQHAAADGRAAGVGIAATAATEDLNSRAALRQRQRAGSAVGQQAGVVVVADAANRKRRGGGAANSRCEDRAGGRRAAQTADGDAVAVQVQRRGADGAEGTTFGLLEFNAPALLTCSVPPLIATPPVNVLLAPRASVPLPAIARPKLPPILPPMQSVGGAGDRDCRAGGERDRASGLAERIGALKREAAAPGFGIGRADAGNRGVDRAAVDHERAAAEAEALLITSVPALSVVVPL